MSTQSSFISLFIMNYNYTIRLLNLHLFAHIITSSTSLSFFPFFNLRLIILIIYSFYKVPQNFFIVSVILSKFVLIFYIQKKTTFLQISFFFNFFWQLLPKRSNFWTFRSNLRTSFFSRVTQLFNLNETASGSIIQSVLD